MLKGKTKLGNEATAAAGPSGATHAGTVGGTDILTYAEPRDSSLARRSAQRH
jgi:hypothetical protein